MQSGVDADIGTMVLVSFLGLFLWTFCRAWIRPPALGSIIKLFNFDCTLTNRRIHDSHLSRLSYDDDLEKSLSTFASLPWFWARVVEIRGLSMLFVLLPKPRVHWHRRRREDRYSWWAVDGMVVVGGDGTCSRCVEVWQGMEEEWDGGVGSIWFDFASRYPRMRLEFPYLTCKVPLPMLHLHVKACLDWIMNWWVFFSLVGYLVYVVSLLDPEEKSLRIVGEDLLKLAWSRWTWMWMNPVSRRPSRSWALCR